MVSLGPAPGTEVTPWYLKDGKAKEEERGKNEKGKTMHRSITEEEREKKDRKLKDILDPLKEMKKALAVKDGKEKKHKKKEKRDRGETRSGERCEIICPFSSTQIKHPAWLHNNLVILHMPLHSLRRFCKVKISLVFSTCKKLMLSCKKSFICCEILLVCSNSV